MIAVLWITYRVRRSALGRIWVSLGDNEDLSSSLGINAFYQKILAFSVGSFFAGVAGSIYAGYASFISPENFTLRHTIYYLSILIVGGLESISGAIAATVIFTLFSSYLMALYPWDMVIFGSIIVLFVNLIPEGIGVHFGIPEKPAADTLTYAEFTPRMQNAECTRMWNAECEIRNKGITDTEH